MAFKIDYYERLAKRNKDNGVVASLRTDQVDCDEGVAVNVPKVIPITEKVDQQAPQSLPLPLGNKEPEKFKARTIATDFDPATIPTRSWLIRDYLLCGYINLLIAPGAVGKSMFTIVEAISVATGEDILGLGKVCQGNVLIVNNEDDDDELNRRISAICKEYQIEPNTLNKLLFIRSGYGERVVIAQEEDQMVIPSGEIVALINYIVENNIRLLVVDPFVSTHDSNENDNSKIDQVIQVYKQVAKRTNVAIRLVHHTKKLGNDADAHAGDVEIARGASALKDAARVCHTLSLVSESYAKKHEIDQKDRVRLFRLDDAKTNFSLASYKPKFFYKRSVQIENGEWLGVPISYDLEIKPTSVAGKAEVKRLMIIKNVVRAVVEMFGTDGQSVKCTKIRSIYCDIAGCNNATAGKHFQEIPIKNGASGQVKINNKKYRIHQTMEDKDGAPRFVHVYLDE